MLVRNLYIKSLGPRSCMRIEFREPLKIRRMDRLGGEEEVKMIGFMFYVYHSCKLCLVKYAGKNYRDDGEYKVSVLSLFALGFLSRIYRLLRFFMVKRLQKLLLFFVGVAVGASYA